MTNGWISINRSILDHWIWQNVNYSRWWISILLTVNYAEKKFPVGNEIFLCNAGESFRSIEQWAVLFGCSKKTVIKFFKMLENDSMILRKTVGKGNRRKHLLTVMNWDKFQQKETENCPERKPETTPKGNPTLPPNNNKDKKNNETIIEIIDFFNETCVSLPSVKNTPKRVKSINARIKEHSFNEVLEMITTASKSDFLAGQNQRDWMATFDWLIRPNNFVKVLEGNYNNKINSYTKNRSNNRGHETEKTIESTIAEIEQTQR